MMNLNFRLSTLTIYKENRLQVLQVYTKYVKVTDELETEKKLYLFVTTYGRKVEKE